MIIVWMIIVADKIQFIRWLSGITSSWIGLIVFGFVTVGLRSSDVFRSAILRKWFRARSVLHFL